MQFFGIDPDTSPRIIVLEIKHKVNYLSHVNICPIKIELDTQLSSILENLFEMTNEGEREARQSCIWCGH